MHTSEEFTPVTQAHRRNPNRRRREGSLTRTKMRWKIFGVAMSATCVVVALLVTTIVVLDTSSSKADAATMPIVVATPSGRYQGTVRDGFLDGTHFVAYTSIPFAQPPLGPLRFKRPQPVSQVPASQFANSGGYQKSCWSVTKTTASKYYGEDCLYLNVYAPGDGSATNSMQKLPVMVWIHGGGFVAGSAFPEPIKMVTEGNVIVVNVNYRMGVYGFLTTEDDALPGNNGLWDMYMALKWVKENIEFFNGDKSSITLFGESAGAISTGLLAISPVSSSLFHKAILQSGAVTSQIQRSAVSRAKEFASRVGCSDSLRNHVELAECLRNVSIDDIQANSKPDNFDISDAQKQADFIWMPVIDGELIPDEPLALLSNRSYLKSVGAFDKDYMFGVLNGEGSLVAENFLNRVSLSDVSTPEFTKNLTKYLMCNRYTCNKEGSEDRIFDAAYTFYLGSDSLESPLRPQNILDIYADATFIAPAMEMALSISSCSDFQRCQSQGPSNVSKPEDCPTSNGVTYFYHFNYCPARDPCKPPCMNHGDEVSLQFPKRAITDPTLKKFSDMFVNVLTEFAKSSTPGTAFESGWPTFNPETQTYLNLDLEPSVRSYPYDYRMRFWLTEIPNLLKGSV